VAKITPAMIAAARGADPAFAGVSDVAMRAALEPHWALCRQGRGQAVASFGQSHRHL
jgi:hypothetical protein